MKQIVKRNLIITLLLMLSAVSGGRAFAGSENNVSASYLYTLSNFTGISATTWGVLAVDESVNEVYISDASGIKVFNDSGMEIYSFNDQQLDLGNVLGLAVDDTGNVIVLVSRQKSFELIRCNYRGEPVSKIELKKVPAEFAGFSPNDILFRNGSLYLVNYNEMIVMVTDKTGLFKEGYDLARLIGYSEKDRDNTGIGGFGVDPEGNLLFTIQATAKAYVVSPDRTVRSFGRSGSTPGSFGVPGGIVTDASDRYILVADTLRCLIVVFNKDLKFVTEFGYRGLSPDALVGPLGLAVDGRNRLYVTQLRNRGVNVYQIAVGS